MLAQEFPSIRHAVEACWVRTLQNWFSYSESRLLLLCLEGLLPLGNSPGVWRLRVSVCTAPAVISHAEHSSWIFIPCLLVMTLSHCFFMETLTELKIWMDFDAWLIFFFVKSIAGLSIKKKIASFSPILLFISIITLLTG